MLRGDAARPLRPERGRRGPEPGRDLPAVHLPARERRQARTRRVPTRLEPFREYTVVFHDEMAVSNAFPLWYQRPGRSSTRCTRWATSSRSTTAPAASAPRSSPTGSASARCTTASTASTRSSSSPRRPSAIRPWWWTSRPTSASRPARPRRDRPGAARRSGPKATRAFYPDDPSNVHHSYISDFVKFRNVHTGKEHHIFHLHNHQWLFNPNDDNSNYLDAQGIGPGGGYTYEINFGGVGQPEQERRRRHLPLPLLPALRPGHVGAVAHPRRARDRHAARRHAGAATGPGFHTALRAEDGTRPGQRGDVTIPNPAPVRPAARRPSGPGGPRPRAARRRDRGRHARSPPSCRCPARRWRPMPGKVTVVPKVPAHGGRRVGSNARWCARWSTATTGGLGHRL